MKNQGIILSLLLMLTVFQNTDARNLTFDNLIANGGSSKAIPWTTSLFGIGFDHRIINVDPGELTTLNFQTIHHTATWTNLMVLTSTGNVGIVVSIPYTRFEVNNTIKTRKVCVTATGLADYVFDSAYNLIPLLEEETFLQKNGHLPNCLPKRMSWRVMVLI